MGLDTVELIMAIEEEFAINIPDENAANLETVGGLYRYILGNHAIILANSFGQNYAAEVWKRVQSVIVYQLAVKP